MTLYLSATMRERIVADALARRPIEACGVVSAKGRFIPLANAQKAPDLFAFHPAEQLAVWRELDAAGDEVAVVYHSHPSTPAVPSTTDVKFAAYPNVHYVIVSLAAPSRPDVRSWRIAGDEVAEEDVFWY
jgi:proteasome lid subunit RPN8/RPN11